MFACKFNLPQLKRHGLSNDFRMDLRKLGKKKSQNWVETQANIQSNQEKLIFENSGQNLRKSRYRSFLAFSSFALFSYLWQYILLVRNFGKKHLTVWLFLIIYFKDTHKENTYIENSSACKKMIMNLWVVDALNQLFIRGWYCQIKFSKI